MTFTLPNLPFAKDALEPHISARTLEFHHGKHHNAYVTNLNGLIDETDLADKSLEQIITATRGDAARSGIFNNAAQVWNHTFFWNSLSNAGGGEPKGTLRKKIDEDFGGLDKFRADFKQAAVTQFGSGWAWLVLESGKLKIVKTANAETPAGTNTIPLLTVDVWEHAYYLDFQNRRPDFVDTFLNHLANWDFAEKNLKNAL